MSAPASVSRRALAATPSGESVDLITLDTGTGLTAELATWGATLTSLRVPDASGRIADVVLGFDALQDYVGVHPYWGGVIGRFANRIARGRFTLDGREYRLACNDGPNHLHGGIRGFDRRLWTAEAGTQGGSARAIFSRVSADGEEGYPGRLEVRVTFTLGDRSLRVDYEARTDRPTVVNLTHHPYFDLSGGVGPGILDHSLTVDADAFLPVDETLIPTGGPRPVEGTPFDLRDGPRLRDRLFLDDLQLSRGLGFDHNFALAPRPAGAEEPRFAARLADPLSGRVMEILTTEPGLQVYTGGALDGTCASRDGRPRHAHAALCLETQAFPDSPNRPDFPDCRLDPGAVFRSSTLYRFSTA